MLVTSCEELTHWKRPWCWEGLGAGGEGDDKEWDGWMASLTRWTRVWVNSGSWWWTGRPVCCDSWGCKESGHDWVTELNWTPWKESYDQPIQHIKKQRHYFVNKGLSSQGYDFSNSHVWMWELDYKQSWAPKNWCFWTVVLEKTLESPLDCKEIQPVHPKDQSWVFIGRTDAESETSIFWPPDAKNWVIRKDPDAGKDWRREEKGMTRIRLLDGITD